MNSVYTYAAPIAMPIMVPVMPIMAQAPAMVPMPLSPATQAGSFAAPLTTGASAAAGGGPTQVSTPSPSTGTADSMYGTMIVGGPGSFDALMAESPQGVSGGGGGAAGNPALYGGGQPFGSLENALAGAFGPVSSSAAPVIQGGGGTSADSVASLMQTVALLTQQLQMLLQTQAAAQGGTQTQQIDDQAGISGGGASVEQGHEHCPMHDSSSVGKPTQSAPTKTAATSDTPPVPVPVEALSGPPTGAPHAHKKPKKHKKHKKHNAHAAKGV